MKRFFLLLALCAGMIKPSHAQFGDFLKSVAADAARNAAAGQVRNAVTGAVDSAARSVTQPASQPASQPATQPNGAAAPSAQPPAAARPSVPPGCGRIYGPPLAIGERPESYQPASLWPENTCPVSNHGDLKFDKALAAKRAFVEASKVRCNDCEGGYWPDAWGWRSLVKNSRDYGKDYAALLIALKQGESLKWKGEKYDATVTATGAHPIGELPCRQFHYELKDKGKLVAEYDSLYCEYVEGYSTKASWNEKV